jgi:hypothetical protein
MGIRGLYSGLPEPPDGICEGPSVEPPVGRVLLGAQADGVLKGLCADEAIWPRVLTPIDGALASVADAVALPTGRVRGEVDPLSEGPTRAFSSIGSPSPSTGAETSLDT